VEIGEAMVKKTEVIAELERLYKDRPKSAMPKKQTKNQRTRQGAENINRLLTKADRLPEGERKSPGGTDVLSAVIAEWPKVQPAITSSVASTENLDLAHTRGAETRKNKAEKRHNQWRGYAQTKWTEHPDWDVNSMASHVKEHFKSDREVSTIADALAGIKARALRSKR
jgi:hypothetical protein